MRRTLDSVPRVVDLETDGEVWASFALSLGMRVGILASAIREHQSIQTATERFVGRLVRYAIAVHLDQDHEAVEEE